MINMTDIAHVRQRIAAIQQQFGKLQQVPGTEFGQTPARAIQTQDAAAKAQAQAPQTARRQSAGVASPKQAAALNVGTGMTAVSDLPPADADLSAFVQQAAREYNVDPRLVSAVAQTESGGDQSAVSPAGAIGVVQLMPDTAASLGVNPYDEMQNVEGCAKCSMPSAAMSGRPSLPTTPVPQLSRPTAACRPTERHRTMSARSWTYIANI